MLDTSVLIHDPDSIASFQDNVVVVPIWVIEELDRIKEGPGNKAVSARQASRNLLQLQSRGDINIGVPTDTGGTLVVDYRGMRSKKMRVRLEDTYDNRIISVAYQWHENEQRGARRKVVLVSKDGNMILKAAACGVAAQDYETDKKIRSLDELYTGCVTLNLSRDTRDICMLLHQDREIEADLVLEYADIQTIPANACCDIVLPGGKICHALYKRAKKKFTLVSLKEHHSKSGGIAPKNIGQAFAYRLLQDRDIDFVSLVGKAGTGKTLMALLVGYIAEFKDEYDSLLVYRPTVEMGKELGALPGELREKFAPSARPVVKLLERIVKSFEPEQQGKRKGENLTERLNGKFGMGARQKINELIDQERLELSPINFSRGDNLYRQFVVVDEAQNLTPVEVKTLATRPDEGTKFVITGDPTQIDHKFLGPTSNGLTYFVEDMKDDELVGHITLTEIMRSRGAELAARRLT